MQLPQFGSTTFTAESNFPFIDATGDCAMFETYPTAPYGQPKLYVYNCENPSRELRTCWAAVQDNTFHLNSNGMDDLLGGHWRGGPTNMDGMIDLGMLSVETVDSRYYYSLRL